MTCRIWHIQSVVYNLCDLTYSISGQYVDLCVIRHIQSFAYEPTCVMGIYVLTFVIWQFQLVVYILTCYLYNTYADLFYTIQSILTCFIQCSKRLVYILTCFIQHSVWLVYIPTYFIQHGLRLVYILTCFIQYSLWLVYITTYFIQNGLWLVHTPTYFIQHTLWLVYILTYLYNTLYDWSIYWPVLYNTVYHWSAGCAFPSHSWRRLHEDCLVSALTWKSQWITLVKDSLITEVYMETLRPSVTRFSHCQSPYTLVTVARHSGFPRSLG